MGRARLRTANRGAASQLQLTEQKKQHVAQRGLRAQARKLELKVYLGPQSYSIRTSPYASEHDYSHYCNSLVNWNVAIVAAWHSVKPVVLS